MKAAGAAGLPFWKASQRDSVSELSWEASASPPPHFGFAVLVVGARLTRCIPKEVSTAYSGQC